MQMLEYGKTSDTFEWSLLAFLLSPKAVFSWRDVLVWDWEHEIITRFLLSFCIDQDAVDLS